MFLSFPNTLIRPEGEKYKSPPLIRTRRKRLFLQESERRISLRRSEDDENNSTVLVEQGLPSPVLLSKNVNNVSNNGNIQAATTSVEVMHRAIEFIPELRLAYLSAEIII